MNVAFTRPFVAQYRNVHNYMADFAAEKNLYEQADELTKYLLRWRSKRKSLEGRYEELIVALHEIGVLELEDVLLAQEWLTDLRSFGYRFPKLQSANVEAQDEEPPHDVTFPVVDQTDTNMALELEEELAMSRPPPPSSRTFCGRIPVRLRSKRYQLEGMYSRGGTGNILKLMIQFSIGAERAAKICADACTEKTSCQEWSIVMLENGIPCRLTIVPPLADAELRAHEIPIYTNDSGISGTPERFFTLWRSPSILARHKRTLLVVNWHWPTTNLEIATWMMLHAFRLPEDVDIVHVAPFVISSQDAREQAWALTNPWTRGGYFSYISPTIAANTLPGYRGYVLTNDDVFIRWDLLNERAFAKLWATPGKWQYPPVNQVANDSWDWLDLDVSVDETVRRNCPQGERVQMCHLNSAFGRYGESVSAVAHGQSDFFYVPAARMDKFTHWAKLLVSNGVFLELAVPTTFLRLCQDGEFGCKQHQTPCKCWDELEYATTWNSSLRGNPLLFVNASSVIAHPLKPSHLETRHWLITKFGGI